MPGISPYPVQGTSSWRYELAHLASLLHSLVQVDRKGDHSVLPKPLHLLLLLLVPCPALVWRRRVGHKGPHCWPTQLGSAGVRLDHGAAALT